MRASQLLGAIAGLAAAAVTVTAAPVHAMPPDRIDPPPIEVENEPFEAPANGFQWRMDSRFGGYSGGLVDFHWDAGQHAYDPGWVDTDKFTVRFDGCPTESELKAAARPGASTENTYTWEIEGEPTVSKRACWHAASLSEGTHRVRLTITRPDGEPYAAGPYVQDIDVEDLLIVSLGDSYASGEGNPDIPRLWQSGLFGIPYVAREASWVDRRCHRSAAAGPAQAARALEAADLHTSVTFVSFACSGATIDTEYREGQPLPLSIWDPYVPGDGRSIGTGVLGGYDGAEPTQAEKDAGQLPAQIEAMTTTVGNRPIDALIISGGGNDIGFGPIAQTCIVRGPFPCPNEPVHDDQTGGTMPLSQRVARDAENLKGKFDRLAQAIETVPADRVYLTAYPDSTRGDDGDYCASMLDDVVPTLPIGSLAAQWFGPQGLALGALFNIRFQLDAGEAAWASEHVLAPLNQAVKTAADDHGFHIVRFDDEFDRHGYCASQNWIRTAAESEQLQGPTGILWLRKDTKGTLHPTYEGHQQYSRRLLEQLRPKLLPPAPVQPPQFTSADAAAGDVSTQGANGWLIGRCAPAGQCFADYAAVGVEATTERGLAGAGLQVNGVPDCSAPGVSCEPAPGPSEDGKRYRWSVRMTDGVYRLEFTASGVDGQIANFGREVKVDLHDPAPSTATPTAAAPASGWYRGPVQVKLDGADVGLGSGVERIVYRIDDQAPIDAGVGTQIEISGDGVHTVTHRAIDFAGRAGPASTLTVRIDGQAPAITCETADGGWSVANVTRGCTAGDQLSGLVGEDAAFTLKTAVAPGIETTDAMTDAREVCDRAGNCAQAGPVTGIKIDRKPATVSIALPAANAAYTLGASVSAEYTCADGGAGVASCSGPVPRGAAIDTATIGTKAFAVDAADAVGNSSRAEISYRVEYAFSGFRFPVANPPSLNVVDAGSPVPIRFALGGNQGPMVVAPTYPRSVEYACGSAPSTGLGEPTASVAGSGTVYVPFLNEYVYAWDTERKPWRDTCRQFILKLADGTVHRANFKFVR